MARGAGSGHPPGLPVAVGSGGPASRFFGQILTSVQAYSYLAWCLGEQGDFAAAIDAARRGLAEAEREEHRYSQAIVGGLGDLVYLRKGDLEAARCLLEPAVELVRTLELSLIRSLPLANLGLTYVYRGAVEAGLALVAHCHLGLGKLYRRTGQSKQALEQLKPAAAMYREMGMTYWLQQAEAELRRNEPRFGVFTVA